jgi:hypothetical protein
MNVEAILAGLARPALVESVYLVGRYLSHRLTRDVFLRQLQADIDAPDRDDAVATALLIVRDIERQEGAPIEDLPEETRASYANLLDEVLRKHVEPSMDTAEVDEVLSELRECA